MTPQQIIGLLLRLASIWLLMIAFQCCMMVSAAFGFINVDASAAWIAFAMLPAALAIFLWMFPMLTAKKLLPHATDVGSNVTPIQEAAAVAIIVLGVFTMLKGVPIIFGALAFAIVAPDGALAGIYFEGERGTMFIGSIVQFVVGLGLLCMPRMIARQIFPSPALRSDRKTV